MKSSNKNQDKTYKRALNAFEMFADVMPSKKQKREKTKMRQQGKKEIKAQTKE